MAYTLLQSYAFDNLSRPLPALEIHLLAIVEGFAKANSVFIVITLAMIMPG